MATILQGILDFYTMIIDVALRVLPEPDDYSLIPIYNFVSIIFSAIFAFELYDKVTTPNENTKTTDLYRITKEKNYLTFTAKKPYNHLYRTKTMEITYSNSGEYVIVTDHQAYRIPKESVSE